MQQPFSGRLTPTSHLPQFWHSPHQPETYMSQLVGQNESYNHSPVGLHPPRIYHNSNIHPTNRDIHVSASQVTLPTILQWAYTHLTFLANTNTCPTARDVDVSASQAYYVNWPLISDHNHNPELVHRFQKHQNHHTYTIHIQNPPTFTSLATIHIQAYTLQSIPL